MEGINAEGVQGEKCFMKEETKINLLNFVIGMCVGTIMVSIIIGRYWFSVSFLIILGWAYYTKKVEEERWNMTQNLF